MFREFAIILCIAVVVCASSPTHNEQKNSGRSDETHLTATAPRQDNTALPSEVSYQSVVPPSSKYLPAQAPSSAYEVNSGVVKTVSGPVPVVSRNAYQKTNIVSATVATDSSSPESYDVPVSYGTNAAPIRPYYSSPVAAKTLTIESQGAGYAHRPVADAAYSYSGSPATVYYGNAAPASQVYAVPLVASTVKVESQGPVNAPRPVVSAAHGQNVGPVLTYASNVAPASQYYAVPLNANTASVESHGAVNTQSVDYASRYHNVGPVVLYTSNAAPAKPYYAVPLAAKSVKVQSHGKVNAHPPVPFTKQQLVSTVAYSTNAPPASPYYSVPIAANTGTFQSPAVNYVTYPGNYVQTAVNPPVAQYVTAPAVKYVAAPVSSKTVTEESFNSIIAHPPSAPKYASAPELVMYAPAPVQVAKQVPVPVIYQASGVETHHPSAQQFAVVTKTVAPTPSYAQASVGAQSIAINSAGADVRFNPVPVPVVHAESFIEKVYSPVNPTPVAPAAHSHGYARAVTFSPASAVSRVTFNGLGISYGW